MVTRGGGKEVYDEKTYVVFLDCLTGKAALIESV